MGRTLRGAVDVYSNTSPGWRTGWRPVTPSPCTTSFMLDPTVWISNRLLKSCTTFSELFVIRTVYWKQCFRMGGSEFSALYPLDTSTVKGPVVATDPSLMARLGS